MLIRARRSATGYRLLRSPGIGRESFGYRSSGYLQVTFWLMRWQLGGITDPAIGAQGPMPDALHDVAAVRFIVGQAAMAGDDERGHGRRSPPCLVVFGSDVGAGIAPIPADSK